MKEATLRALMEGQVRPRRIYEKEYQASGCGRVMVKIGGGGKTVILVTPSKVFVTTDKEEWRKIREQGYECVMVEEMGEVALKGVIQETPKESVRRALRWCIGRG